MRSAGCRVPGEGWAWGSFVLQLERGVGFQQARLGEGSLPSLAVRELALQASGADSFLSRAEGPRDCSPLSGLGGERPKGLGEQEGRPGAIWPDWGVGGRAPNPFFLNEFCRLLVTRSSEQPLSGEGGTVSLGTHWDHGLFV